MAKALISLAFTLVCLTTLTHAQPANDFDDELVPPSDAASDAAPTVEEAAAAAAGRARGQADAKDEECQRAPSRRRKGGESRGSRVWALAAARTRTAIRYRACHAILFAHRCLLF